MAAVWLCVGTPCVVRGCCGKQVSLVFRAFSSKETSIISCGPRPTTTTTAADRYLLPTCCRLSVWFGVGVRLDCSSHIIQSHLWSNCKVNWWEKTVLLLYDIMDHNYFTFFPHHMIRTVLSLLICTTYLCTCATATNNNAKLSLSLSLSLCVRCRTRSTPPTHTQIDRNLSLFLDVAEDRWSLLLLVEVRYNNNNSSTEEYGWLSRPIIIR